MKPYLCENTIVTNRENQVGRVVGINREKDVVLLRGKFSFWTEKMESLVVISYKEVQ